MKKILINIDCGEGFGIYKNKYEEELIKNADLINIACGFHAGDPEILREVVKLAKKNNVLVGAHPSYPDLVGFGRRSIKMTPGEIENMIIYQLGVVYAFLKVENMVLYHVKPHGALYNDSVNDEKIAEAIGKGVLLFDKNLYLVGLSSSKQIDVWENMGLKVLKEVFLDRAYFSNGTLVPRNKKDSIIFDLEKIKKRVENLKVGKLDTIDGILINIDFDTICIHSDTPNSYLILKLAKDLI